MAVDDFGDELAELRELKRRVDRLESGSMLENSSITRGRMRFIGGELRLDSGATLTLIGTMNANGTINITGLLNGSGQLVWSGSVEFTGPWNFEGDGTISGDVTATGKWTQNGPWEFNGAGDISGDVTVDGDFSITEPGMFTVGESVTIDPAHSPGGQIKFDDTAEIYGGGTGTNAQLQFVVPGDPGASILLQADGIRIPYGLTETTGGRFLGIDDFGKLIIKLGGTGGGPGDGIFAWPFSLDLVTSEFGPRTYPYTGFHEGIDFGNGVAGLTGTTIPSAGSGTVITSTYSSGYGNHVVIDHGTDPLYDGGSHNIKTLYGHMFTAPDVNVGDAVALGDRLGGIGNTGNSFGAHLHFEIWVDDVKVNPRTFMASHGG